MCGQCAYIGPSEQWSYEYFKLAALMQDAYGRDNAGFAHILPSGEYEIAKCSPQTGSLVFDLFDYEQDHIIGSSLYELMCLNKDIPRQIEGNIVIAHSRKGSVGDDTIDMAQPLEIDCGDYKLLLTHNGTIYNYEEILQCLSIEESCNNDTHAIGLALKHKREKEFFELINGTATCMWIRSDMPSTIFACGVTKDVKTKTEYLTRPLHFARVGKAIYISRDKLPISYIKGIHTNEDNLTDTSITYSIPANTIFSFYMDDQNNATYGRISDFERNPLMPPRKQVNHIEANSTPKSTPTISTTEEMVELLREDKAPQETSSTHLEYFQSLYYIAGVKVTTPYEVINNNRIVITSQTYVSREGQLVFEREGRYYFYEGRRYKGATEQLTAHYFLNGVMMLNKAVFELTLNSYPDMNFRPLDIAASATHPIWVGAFNKFGYVTVKNLHNFPCSKPINAYSEYTVNGVFTPLYCDKTYVYKNGKIFKIKRRDKNRKILKRIWASKLLELKLYNNYSFRDNVNYVKGETAHERKQRITKAAKTLLNNTVEKTERKEIDHLVKELV